MTVLINPLTAQTSNGNLRIPLEHSNLIPRGQGRCFSIGQLRVAVFRQRDDTFFALENSCPHQGGPLADGVVGAGVVVCPLHSHSFRLADGSGIDTTLHAKSFPLQICDGFLWIQVGTNT